MTRAREGPECLSRETLSLSLFLITKTKRTPHVPGSDSRRRAASTTRRTRRARRGPADGCEIVVSRGWIERSRARAQPFSARRLAKGARVSLSLNRELHFDISRVSSRDEVCEVERRCVSQHDRSERPRLVRCVLLARSGARHLDGVALGAVESARDHDRAAQT